MADTSRTRALAEFLAGASRRPLPADVREGARLHLLDTMAAIVSGASLESGRLAAGFVSREGASADAVVVGAGATASAADAALANGMSGHADETDDSHSQSHVHPGCSIVPAALAVAEREHASGEALLRAVVYGYDAGCRVAMGLGPIPGRVEAAVVDNFAIGGTFGAAAAAATILNLDPRRCCSVLAYAAQLAWGFGSYMRGPDHVEKAFVFGGGQSRDGVMAATMVQRGFSGVEDVFDGKINYLDALSPCARPEALTEALGERWEVLRASIKRYPVGSPLQPVVEGMRRIMESASLRPDEIEQVELRLPARNAAVVDDRDMPDVNAQYIAAVMLLEGGLRYHSAHDFARMSQPDVLEMRRRVSLIGDESMPPTPQARVEVRTKDGRVLSEHVTRASVRGGADNPMTREDVVEKATELICPIAGDQAGRELIDRFLDIEAVADVRELRPLLLGIRV